MPANTPLRSYPYPLLTDSPNGAGQMQALASAVDTDMQAQVTAIATAQAGVNTLTGRFAKYTAAINATGQNQAIATNATTAVQLINARKTSALVVPSGTNNTTFTLGAAGNWSFTAGARISPGTTGAHFLQLLRNDTSEILAALFLGSLSTGSIYDLGISGADYFASTGISVTLNVVTSAGVAGSTIASGAVASGLRTFLAMQWEGS